MIRQSKLFSKILILVAIIVFPLVTFAQTPIPCGQPISDSISIAGEKDDYTFTASPNDKVTIRLIVTSGDMNPYLELYDSAMIKIASNYSSSGNYTSIDKVLTAGGTYTIRVYDYNNDETGDYSLFWQKVNNPCGAAPITCGQTTPGSLSTTGERDFYTFTATTGDAVTIRLIKTLGTFQPKLTLYDSTGTSIASSYNSSGNDVVIDRSLSLGGAYILEVSDYGDNAIGDYNLTWQKLNNPCNPAAITCGQSTSSSLSAVGEQDFYAFTATAGDAVTIRVARTSGGMNPYIELYDSAGTRIAYSNALSGNYINLDKTLTSDGTYTIVVSDYGNNAKGNYKITFQKLNNPCNALPITCGQTLTGSISAAGEQDIYTFTESEGSAVQFVLTRLSGTLDPSLELYDNTGKRLAYPYTSSGSSITLNQTLPSSGQYVIFVSDYGNDDTGTYRIKFQKNNNSCTEVILNAPNGNEIIEAGSICEITWKTTSNIGISLQGIKLSTNGGSTFPTVIATGLSGSVQSFSWSIPTNIKTAQARIRITVIDTLGASVYDDSDYDFIILQNVPKVTRAYEYDKLNRLSKIINEDGSQINYTYDAVGNRITLTSAVLLLPPSSLTAKSTSSSSIVLAWKDNSTDETGFKIERKIGGCDSVNSWSQIAEKGADVTTHTNTGLTPNTTYSYRVMAYNAGDNSAYSNCASAKTGVSGSPNSPSNLDAVSVSSNKIDLSWKDNSADETGFKVYRKAGTGSWTLLTTTPANVESYSDTTATGNTSTRYSYYIKACNGSGCSPQTNVAVIPYKPTGLTATPVSSSQINIKWIDKSNNETGFEIYRKSGVCSSANSWSKVKTIGPNVSSYSNTGLSSGETYSYKTRAYNKSSAAPYAYGYSAYSNCKSATTP